MSNQEEQETTPIPVENDGETQTAPVPSDDDIPELPAPEGQKKFPWVRVIVLGWVILLGIAGLAAYSGFQQGVSTRVSQSATETAGQLERQYQLGLEDFSNGFYQRAIQRFDFILSQDPNNAKAIEMLARTRAIVDVTATPTVVLPTPTPTLTPTPDLRGQDERFNNAEEDLNNGNWDQAISTLLTLRKTSPDYRAIDVDSMLYVALRNRGVQKILEQGELEVGLYDLSQAEQFGPLDIQASNARDWARFYIIGASFWDVDWGNATFYFGQVAFAAPNLNNNDNWTASRRYRTSLENHILALFEQKRHCEALVQHEILGRLDPSLIGTEDYERRVNTLDDRCEADKAEQGGG
jgi:tetratricopeptide (TPR) repeat protein